ncbi:Os03g0647575, partial [Oryza sativa Japonica Group]
MAHPPAGHLEAARVKGLLLLPQPPPLLLRLHPERGGEGDVAGTVAATTTEEEVFLCGALEHGVDVADLDDGLERLARAAGEGERVAPLL